MTTDAAFLRSIEADLADPAPLLIYADWLEEHGQEQLAHAWRWMARRGYRPAKRTRPGARMPWAWWHPASDSMEPTEERADVRAHPEARLPWSVFCYLGGGHTGAHAYCPTLVEAVDRLAQALEHLHQLSALAGLERQAGDP